MCADTTSSCGSLRRSMDTGMGFLRIVEADSKIAWAFEPPIPKELTLILWGLRSGHGVGSRGTCKLASANGILGFGVWKWIFGGIVLCSSDRMALIMLVIPEAPSEWPTFGFTCRDTG